MRMKTILAPKRSSGKLNGFEFVIHLGKMYSDQHTWLAHWLRNDIRAACEKTLGKEYRSTLRRGGKRKWYCEERRTFTRYYFRSDACRTLLLLNLNG
jgi:hypothetical protein